MTQRAAVDVMHVPLQLADLDELFPSAQFLNRAGPLRMGGFTCDSRAIRRGDLFVAVPGAKVDGRRFITQAVRTGAAAVLTETPDRRRRVLQCVVDDARAAYARLCHRGAGFPARQLAVTGVTGTNGKTTTTFLIRSILQAAGRRSGLVGTISYDHGASDSRAASMTTPDPPVLADLLAGMVAADCTHAVMEVSSHALDQRRVEGIDFAVAAFTNLSGDHLDYHKTMARYRQAKGRLFAGLGPDACAVLNADDPAGAYYARRAGRARVLTYGIHAPADIRADILDQGLQGSRFVLHTPSYQATVHTPLVGQHNVYNCLAAAGVAEHFKVDRDAVREGLEALHQVAGRLEPVDAGQPFTVLVDYAHTDDALDNVLGGLKKLTPGRLICVFGAGGDRDSSKRPRMGAAVEKHADAIWITNDNPRTETPQRIADQILAGIRNRSIVHVQLDRRQAMADAFALARPGDCVLIAGKGHEDYQESAQGRVPFDDRQVARDVLSGTGSPTSRVRSGASGADAAAGSESKAIPLGRPVPLDELGRAVGGRFLRKPTGDMAVERLSTDSRTIRAGELFWALRGDRFDGHAYVGDALGKGVCGAVVSADVSADDLARGPGFVLQVADTLHALGALAGAYRRTLGAQVVGVTGSVGKSTTKEMIYQVLSRTQHGIRSCKSYNNSVGLPLTVLRAAPTDQFAVLEMGTNHPGEIAGAAAIAQPDIGVITTIGAVHLEGLGDLPGVARAKGELLDGLGPDAAAVLNIDNPWVCGLIPKCACALVTVGTCPEADVRASAIEGGPDWLQFRVDDGLCVRLPVGGRHNVTNALCAIAVARRLGVPDAAIREGLTWFEPLPMRCQVESVGGVTLINDAYNANPCSMEAGLAYLTECPARGRRVLVCGDMKELGPQADQYHAALGRRVARSGVDLCFSVGEISEAVTRAAREEGMPARRVRHFPDARSAADPVATRLAPGDVVLVKGSRAVALEVLVEALKRRLSPK